MWWTINVDKFPNIITLQTPNLTLTTDSSLTGWGTVIITYLELKATPLGLQSLCSHLKNCHIKVLCDKSTAVSYIRNMRGSKSRNCNDITREIMMWCMETHLSLSVSHIPGKLDTAADKASREFQNNNTEWSLDPTIFNELTSRWGEPEIDMFASRLNHKLTSYEAWKPDPGTVAIDAFTLDWSKYHLIYRFPPFSLISKVLLFIQKAKQQPY